MKFTSEENKQRFLNDKKYYENSEDYCLGDSLEEAGEIMRAIIKAREEGKNKEAG